MPAAVAPELAPGDPFVLIAGFLENALHRRVHRVALDPVQPELAESKSGAHPNRIGRIALAPGRSLADDQTAGRPAVSPVDLVQADEPDVPALLVDDRPDEVTVSPRLDRIEEELFLAPAEAQIELERRRDLGVVHPDQGVLEVKRPVRWNQPDALAALADDLHQHLLTYPDPISSPDTDLSASSSSSGRASWLDTRGAARTARGRCPWPRL